VSERCGAPYIPPFTCIGEEADGRIVCGAVFNSYTGPDIEVSIACSRKRFSKAFINACLQYVFGTLGCERCTMTTEHGNVARMAIRFGARLEGIKLHQYGAGRNGYILGVYKKGQKVKRNEGS
jgi:RimJ/RimL family protein N-acetyltransferase